ncbi:MAG: AMP-binding protein [Thermoleophilaceae bacterium]
MSENLARILTTAAEESPDGIAVKLDDIEVSYAALEEGSARMAAVLKDRGVGPGDRVGLMLPNVPYFPVVYYGVLRLGGVVVPMNPLLKGREVKFYLEDPAAEVLVAWHDFEEPATKGAEEAGAELILVKPGEFEQLLGGVEEPLHVMEDRDAAQDTAVILYTSGTTGQPKGAELTHANLYKNCTVAADHLGEISKDDRLLGALPLFHSFGQTCTLNAGIHAQAMISMIPASTPRRRWRSSSGTRSRCSRAYPRCTTPCSPSPTRTTTTPRRCACACPAARRCPRRSCASSRRPSAARCWRATASPRPRPWRPSTTPTSRTRRAR